VQQWLGFGTLTLVTSGYLLANLMGEVTAHRTAFLPGTTTGGHHQIESACESCHTPFGGVNNDACLTCHAEELRVADDSHPMAKFTDPRNADRLLKLDATQCVTCHREHTPGIVRPMGVTLPDDYCVLCHEEVGRDRPSHKDLAFTTCATSGCHNYHDNSALYEDFLVAHASEPVLRPQPRVAVRERSAAVTGGSVMARVRLDADAGRDLADPQHVASWEAAAHARAGVNCSGCHVPSSGPDAGNWLPRPAERECASCHASEVTGFGAGRHGMRQAAGLGRMTPAQARLPMKVTARNHDLSCGSCHQAHEFDTADAAVDACLVCHDDSHSRAYRRSPHATLWALEKSGEAPAGSGVSCATCHMPRRQQKVDGKTVVTVQHNQNDNLRPNEKMLRTVCLDCHGLGFSVDALADPSLIAANFSGRPVRSVAGIDMATKRLTTKSK
jgi:hypothetical protein